MHLQEIMEIGAIPKSSNPLASVVMLVQKEDGNLHFCIVLYKLNAMLSRMHTHFLG